MKSHNIFALLLVLGLVACGKDGGSSGSSPAKGTEERVEQELVEATPGTYYTVLRPINFNANGFIAYGAATFSLQGDQLQVDISMDDDQPVMHRQSLHSGTRCPTLADDTNGDGFVDYNEALSVVGPVVMPLDNDISSQVAGAEVYPRGPAMTYRKLAALSKINADLWKADEDPADNIIKLATGKGLGFEGRVVLVHGTANQNSFPPSLASYKAEAAHLSLPVVCGVLRKMN